MAVYAPQPDLQRLGALVAAAAREEILPLRDQAQADLKSDGSLVTAVDQAMQDRLQVVLSEHFPDTPLLGEEMSPEQQTQLINNTDSRLWILDPLDGTTNFAAGLPLCATSLALMERGEISLGVIYDPFHDELFSAQRGQGAWLNGRRLSLSEAPQPLAEGVGLIDGKRLPAEMATRLATQSPFRSQRSLGSVALEWCQMAAGRGVAYLHGSQKIWDYAAGLLILEEAGGCACTLAGNDVFTPSLEPRSAVAAPNKATLDIWRQWLGIP